MLWYLCLDFDNKKTHRVHIYLQSLDLQSSKIAFTWCSVQYLWERIHICVLFLKRKPRGVDFPQLDASGLVEVGSGVEGCGEDDSRFEVVNPPIHCLVWQLCDVIDKFISKTVNTWSEKGVMTMNSCGVSAGKRGTSKNLISFTYYVHYHSCYYHRKVLYTWPHPEIHPILSNPTRPSVAWHHSAKSVFDWGVQQICTGFLVRRHQVLRKTPPCFEVQGFALRGTWF